MSSRNRCINGLIKLGPQGGEPEKGSALSYSILDPTGNITALVETPVPVSEQPSMAAAIMRRHPEVEQTGFIQFHRDPAAAVHADLRMAGGEFCGNACLCAAALCDMRGVLTDSSVDAAAPEPDRGDLLREDLLREDLPRSRRVVRLQVSGAAQPVEVHLRRKKDGSYATAVKMPPAAAVEECSLTFEGLSAPVPLVRMEGISHLILRPDCPFYQLIRDRSAAERAIRDWCGALSVEGLGLMFLEQTETGLSLTPLVYIPGSDTVFWENSCASGTSAAGMFLAAESGASTDVTFQEPGGCLSVQSHPGGDTWLRGHVVLRQTLSAGD